MILNVHNEHFSCYYEIVDASTLIEAVKMLDYVECYFVLNNNGHLFSSRTAKMWSRLRIDRCACDDVEITGFHLDT